MFCMKLNNRDLAGVEEFPEISWLLTKERLKQRVSTNIFKFLKSMSPTCTTELYKPFNHDHNMRMSIADYNYHTEIPVIAIKLFLSSARNYGIIYLLI